MIFLTYTLLPKELFIFTIFYHNILDLFIDCQIRNSLSISNHKTIHSRPECMLIRQSCVERFIYLNLSALQSSALIFVFTEDVLLLTLVNVTTAGEVPLAMKVKILW